MQYLADLNQDHLLLTDRGAAWLNRFDAEHREAARRLVNGLTLVSLSNFNRTITQMVVSEAATISGPVGLFAIREIDPTRPYFTQATTGRRRPSKVKTTDAVGRGADIGSEGHVASILRNLSRSDPGKFLNHPTIEKMRDKKCRSIVVVDDLIGTGKRVREFLESIWLDKTFQSWWSSGYIDFKVVAFAGTQAGVRFVEKRKYRASVIINRDCPTFPSLPWPLIWRQRILALCRDYASMTSKPDMRFGYGDVMASLVFEHSCPNGVPAILWAPGGRGTGWRPLFPNRSMSGAAQSVFPPEIVRRDPIAVLIAAGQAKLAKTGLKEIRDDEARQILLIVAMLAKGIRRNAALTYATGLSNAELETVLQQCIDWGFVTSTRRITATGLAELGRVRHGRRLKAKVATMANEDYYPQSLREPIGG